MKRQILFHSGWRTAGCGYLAFMALIVLILGFAGPLYGAQDIQAQDGGSPPVQPAQQSGQYQHAGQQPVDVADIEEDEMTAFDPATIPDAEPAPEADWLFEVPIDVEGISEEVQQIGIKCEVFRFRTDPYDPNHTYKQKSGWAKKKIDLENGAYHGSVLIGVNSRFSPSSEHYDSHRANKYTCWVYLVGPDNNWHIPKKNRNVSPEFRRMSKARPFRWQTGPVTLPQDARLPAP